MFTFDPTLFVDDDEACDEYERSEEEENNEERDEPVRKILSET